MSQPTLELFNTSNIKRLLCIVAHPDDMEYGASAAVAQLTAAGAEVSYLLITAGEAGIREMDPATTAKLRFQEQREACDIVGVDELKILDFPDGLVQNTVELRREIAKTIREIRPDAVMMTSWKLEVEWGFNHVDHRNTGVATIDAIRDADNPWLFQDLHDEGLEAWATKFLLVTGESKSPTHVIEVDQDAVDKGVRSLEAHKVYLEALPDHPAPKEFIPEILKSGGEAVNVDYGLAIAVYPM